MVVIISNCVDPAPPLNPCVLHLQSEHCIAELQRERCSQLANNESNNGSKM